MGSCKSVPDKPKDVVPSNPPPTSDKNLHVSNIHIVQPDIKVHTVVSAELDYDHDAAMKIPLGECNDEQLLAEVARRKLDLHSRITDSLVRETYDFGQILGHGASGQVIQCTHKITGKQYACKIVRKDSNINDAQSMSTEIEIMKRIRHRHVVSMYELYETPKCLWMVLELVTSGDVHHFIANLQFYHEGVAARLMKQVLSGVHYLHSLGIVHRDLKLENILLSDNGPNCDVKIADFGLSALVRLGDGYDPEESSKRKQFKQLKEMWGTKEYFAPELVEQAYGPQADVWACGCILYEMLCGYQAFGVKEFDTEDTFYGRIMRGELDTSRLTWKKISDESKEVIHSMLTIDPVKRISASEGLNLPWIMGKMSLELTNKNLVDTQVVIKQRLEAREKRQREKAKAKQQAANGSASTH